MECLGALRPETLVQPGPEGAPSVLAAVQELAIQDPDVRVVNACGFYVLWPLARKAPKVLDDPVSELLAAAAAEARFCAMRAFLRAAWMAEAAKDDPSFIISATNLAGAVGASDAASEAAFMQRAAESDESPPEPILAEYRSRVERDPNILLPYQNYIAAAKDDFEKEDRRLPVQLAHPYVTSKGLHEGATAQKGVHIRTTHSSPV